MKGVLNFKVRELASGKGSICLAYSFGRKTEIVLATGKYVKNANNWNSHKQRVKSVTAENQSNLINQWLNQLYIDLEKKLTELEFNNPNFTKEQVKVIFRVALGKANKQDIALIKEKVTSPSLKDTYTWYVEYFGKNPTPTTKKPLSTTTIKSFNSTKKKLFEYFKKTKVHQYEDIDMDFYEKFVEWLRSQNYSNNYIANHIKNLKTVLNYALTRGYHNNLTFKKREFAKPTEKVISIFLNEQELEKIFSLSLTGSLAHSRDLFLVGCYTGLRVSDFNNLTEENIIMIDGVTFLDLVSKKTNQRLTIPCNSKVLEIFARHGGKPPKKKPDQHINRDLKIIGDKAKLNDKISVTKTIGGVLTKIPYLKKDLISTHTARRSFCTNAYKAGMQTFDIMAISGHKTEKVFYEYIKATGQDKAKKIAKHPFFK